MLVPWANCSGSGGLNSGLSFWAPLTSTIIPNFAAGSSTPTFTRATLRTCTDQESIVRTLLSGEVGFQGARRVQNLVSPTSHGFAGWTPFQAGDGAVVLNADGSATFSTIASGRIQLGTGSLGSVVPGHTYVLRMKVSNFSGGMGAVGALGLVNVTLASGSSLLAVTGNGVWTTGPMTIATAPSPSFRFGIGVSNTNLSACSFTVDEVQLEDVTGQQNQNPGEYVSVGVLSSPWNGANVDGVQYFEYLNGNTVASNVVTAGAGAAIGQNFPLLGYLAEEARTNLCLQSANFNNASWSKLDTVITTGNTTGPDGAASGDLLTEGVAGNAQVNQVITISANATCTASVFVKRGNSDWLQLFMLDNVTPANQVGGYFNINTGVVGTAINGGTGTGATLGITAYPNGWYRLTLSGAVNNSATAVRLQTNSATANGNSARVNNSTRFQFGAQLEQAAFATSYIPTTTVAVTRNADVLTYPLAGNIDTTVGTAYAECLIPAVDGVTNNYVIASATANTGIYRRISSGDVSIFDQTTEVHGGAWTAGAAVKIAAAWGGNSRTTSNGAAPTSGAFDGDLNFATALSLGNNGIRALNGTVRNVRLWTRALADVQLQQITT